MPNLTSKDLSAIEDQLSKEQLLVKKYKCYACMTNDPQIKASCEQIASKHLDHYNRLLSHLS